MAPPVETAVPVVPAPPVTEIVCCAVPPDAVTPAPVPLAAADTDASAAPAPGVVTVPAAPVAAVPAPAAEMGVTLLPTPTVAAAAPPGVARAAAAGLSPPPRDDRLCSGAVLTSTVEGVVTAGAAPAVAAPAVPVAASPGTAPRPPSADEAAAPLGIGGSPHLMFSDCTLCTSRVKGHSSRVKQILG